MPVKVDSLNLLFESSFRDLQRCPAGCVKCDQKLPSQLTYVPLGEKSTQARCTAVIVCLNCIEILYPQKKVGRKRKSYDKSQVRAKQKMRLDVQKFAEKFAGSSVGGEMIIQDLSGKSKCDKKTQKLLKQLEDNIQFTLSYFYSVLKNNRIYGPVSVSLTRKIQTSKAARLINQTE